MLVLSSAYIVFFQKDLLNNLRSVFASSVLYYNNWWQIFKGFSYFDRFATQSPFTHIWSLAVEAQNYLVWPLLFIALKKYVKHSGKIFGLIMGTAIISGLLMAFLYTPGADPTRVYYGTDTRLFSILLGSGLAFVWPTYRLKEEVPAKARNLLNGVGIASLIVLLLSFLFLADRFSFVYYGGMFIVSIFATILVAVTAHPGADMNRWLTNPVFTWIGKRSYGIYLYQFPVMIFYEAKITNLSDHVLLHSIIELALILGISELSYRYIEKPLGKFYYQYTWFAIKDFFKKPWVTTAKITAVFCTIVSVFAVYALAIAPSNEVTADQQQLQKTIEENKKKAEERKEAEKAKNEGKTADSTEQSTAPPEINVDLNAEELKKAKTMEITAFGDSVILDAAAGLQDIFPKLIVDGEVGRQLYESAPAIQKLDKDKLLKENVLVGLGTNGSFTEAQFDEFMAAIGSKRNVYWINVRVPTRRWQNEVNTMLENMKKKYKNLTVIDWYGYSNAHDEWFYEDRVHPNVDGQVKYSSFIAKEIMK
ncbi:acyltransferase [Enterococcus termitis]|nr:acyltransferase [Enterococcus termitis]